MHAHIPTPARTQQTEKVYIISFAPVGDLQPLRRLVVFIIVLVGSLLLFAICLGNSATRSGMVAFSRSQLGSY